MNPDICTSFSCNPPNKHCPNCSHGIWLGEGTDENGKVWKWEFNPQFGPSFLRKDGEFFVNQPDVKSKAFKLFEEWYEGSGLKNEK